MSLRKIIVNKLFGVFNHKIVLNKEKKITIIIGENGLGKTVLLEMIDNFFNGKYEYFADIDFDEMIFEFEDNSIWTVRKQIDKRDKIGTLVVSLSSAKNTESKQARLRMINYDSLDRNDRERIIRNALRANDHNLRRISPTRFEDIHTGQVLNISQFMNNYFIADGCEIPNQSTALPKWFTDKHSETKVKLIETQRLISLVAREDVSSIRAVEIYSKELATTIKKKLAESTELSSKLDRTYPNRLIARLKESPHISFEDLKEELARLEKKRKLLDKVGLIEIEADITILDIDDPQGQIRDVLMLYVEDSFSKIEIFESIAGKIKIFLDIVNRRFRHKRLYIDKDNGFVIKSTVNREANGEWKLIPVNKLSSGEQNELVLFYLLLFNTLPSSFILIDEPEVSLHISWQNCFIDDIKQIAELNNLDVVIATHSPDIIANNWDLKIELKGLELNDSNDGE